MITFEAYQGYCYSESGGATLASYASNEPPRPDWTGFPVGHCDSAECVSVTDKSENPISFTPGHLRTLRNVIHNITAFHLDGSSPHQGEIGFKSDFIRDPKNGEWATKKIEDYCRNTETLPKDCDDSCEALSLLQCNAVLETLQSGKGPFWNRLPAKVLLGTLGAAVGSYFVGYGFSLGGVHAGQYSPTMMGKALWRHSVKKFADLFSKKGPPGDPPAASGGSFEGGKELRSQRGAPILSEPSPLEFTPASTISTSITCGGAGIFYSSYLSPSLNRKDQSSPNLSETLGGNKSGSSDYCHPGWVLRGQPPPGRFVDGDRFICLEAATGFAEVGLAPRPPYLA